MSKNRGKMGGCQSEARRGDMTVQVEAYSGYKASERPLRFCLGDQWYDITEVVDRWYGPDYMYFRVRAGDGNVYVLRLDEDTQEWSWAGFHQGDTG
jgi:hypothetical protein